MIEISQTSGKIFVQNWDDKAHTAILYPEHGKPIVKSIQPGLMEWDEDWQYMLRDIEILSTAGSDVAPLYICRPVLNGQDIVDWYKAQGFKRLVDPKDMHITLIYSKDAVRWQKFVDSRYSPGLFTLYPDYSRKTIFLGKAVVLAVNSEELETQHYEMRAMGASSDYQCYIPHVTLTYDGSGFKDLNFLPYPGKIYLGPEIFDTIEQKKFVEKSVLNRYTWDRIAGFQRR